MPTIEDEVRRDHETATTALRDLLAETEGKRRNGPASDGRGWFRTEADRDDCYAVADAMLPLFDVRLDWGTRMSSTDPDGPVWDADDSEHAGEMRDSMGWGPVVHRLSARLVDQEWTEGER
ncbi:hypothetical protein [Micromonospora profundi]|uniref:hypothetical protein n=1 Tax=Micromonospora profundi TaxID=1420889 RepID=UPI00364AFBF7